MNDYSDKLDRNWDHGLSAAAARISVPPPADEARQARWRNPSASQPNRATPRARGRRGLIIGCLTTGALAAAIALFALWGPGAATPVSAQMVLTQFREALSGALTIQLEGIDLGTSLIHGDIILDRKGPKSDPATDTMYSEVHILLKADNPQWNDLDSVVIYCKAPSAT